MQINKISYRQALGVLTMERTLEEVTAIAEKFAKYLKLTAKYTYYVENINKSIHFSNRKKWIDISESADNKYIVVTEDDRNNRKIEYYEIL